MGERRGIARTTKLMPARPASTRQGRREQQDTKKSYRNCEGGGDRENTENL